MSLLPHVRRSLALGLLALTACSASPASPVAIGGDRHLAVPPPPAVAADATLACEPGRLPMPLPPGARECRNAFGTTTFRTDRAADEVQRFYAEALPGSGWRREADEQVIVAISLWIKGGERLQIAALREGEATNVSVTAVRVQG